MSTKKKSVAARKMVTPPNSDLPLMPTREIPTRRSVSMSHWEIAEMLRKSRHDPDTFEATDLSQCDSLCLQFADALEAKGDLLFSREDFLKRADYGKDNL